MIEYSKKGPVTIWTGGNLKEIQAEVGPMLSYACQRKNSRLYTRTPILSKHDFRGCKVESVIDDAAQEEFVKDYSITVKEYTQIKAE